MITLPVLAFYMFAAVTIAAGFLVISARNPVHSVLWLILAFFSSAALFVLMGAEFLAMLLVIVYVGAVAVLFLFVVMMLDISFADLRKGAMQDVPIGVLIAVGIRSDTAPTARRETAGLRRPSLLRGFGVRRFWPFLPEFLKKGPCLIGLLQELQAPSGLQHRRGGQVRMPIEYAHLEKMVLCVGVFLLVEVEYVR